MMLHCLQCADGLTWAKKEIPGRINWFLFSILQECTKKIVLVAHEAHGRWKQNHKFKAILYYRMA